MRKKKKEEEEFQNIDSVLTVYVPKKKTHIFCMGKKDTVDSSKILEYNFKSNYNKSLTFSEIRSFSTQIYILYNSKYSRRKRRKKERGRREGRKAGVGVGGERERERTALRTRWSTICNVPSSPAHR